MNLTVWICLVAITDNKSWNLPNWHRLKIFFPPVKAIIFLGRFGGSTCHMLKQKHQGTHWHLPSQRAVWLCLQNFIAHQSGRWPISQTYKSTYQPTLANIRWLALFCWSISNMANISQLHQRQENNTKTRDFNRSSDALESLSESSSFDDRTWSMSVSWQWHTSTTIHWNEFRFAKPNHAKATKPHPRSYKSICNNPTQESLARLLSKGRAAATGKGAVRKGDTLGRHPPSQYRIESCVPWSKTWMKNTWIGRWSSTHRDWYFFSHINQDSHGMDDHAASIPWNKQSHACCNRHLIPIRILQGWWYTYPSEKWWSSSVGMMTFPTEWEKTIHGSKAPTSHYYYINHHFPMVFPWFSHGFPMFFHGFPMVFPWFSHGFPMFFPWFSHVFPWFSHGFPMFQSPPTSYGKSPMKPWSTWRLLINEKPKKKSNGKAIHQWLMVANGY